ncbi:hypothetical protein [Aestuariivivens sediminicola]|uniref:hypothetical protein n=1 Tax=Aestuariivivens sediminicola TaxID=2913560 RepID=UPI001F592C6A|nr:hypothetical protein [Aestuariivivens sediminicola]
MKYKLRTLLVVGLLVFVTKSFAQHKTYNITNGIGVFGALTQFDIETDNFITKQDNGFLFGASATVDIPHRWYNMSYGMQLSENYINIEGRATSSGQGQELIKYKLFAAQLALLGHIKLIGSHLTIDAGPMIQYNGKLELEDDDQKDYFINNYDNLKAEDISSISQFNFNGLIGASIGYGFFRLKAQYIYGFTNMLKKLEDQNLDTTGGDERFKGNQSMLVFGAMISF